VAVPAGGPTAPGSSQLGGWFHTFKPMGKREDEIMSWGEPPVIRARWKISPNPDPEAIPRCPASHDYPVSLWA
jgi:hypothetical protein